MGYERHKTIASGSLGKRRLRYINFGPLFAPPAFSYRPTSYISKPTTMGRLNYAVAMDLK
jgi:hypothetical protein